MSTSRTPRAVALIALVFASLAQAQTTSVLTGTVTDAATGKPLSEVVVTATSPAIQGERTIVTNAAGIYRMLELSPGTYSMRFVKPGFAPFTKEALELKLDRTLRVNAQLAAEVKDVPPAPVAALAPAVVDASNATQGLNVTRDFIDRVALVRPNATGQRGFEALAQAAPQVAPDAYGFGINGGVSPENLYVIDGVTVNDPTYGSLRTPVGIGGAQLPLEFLERVNVITTGAPMEFGRASGGVIDVVTKSGQNELRGSVWGNWWPGALTANALPIRNEASSLELLTRRHNTGDFGADLGGAFIKDRLFFYGGVAQSYDRQRVTRNVNRFLLTDDGQDFLYEDSGALRTERIAQRSRFDDRSSFTWLAKLTLVIAPEHTVALSMTGSPQKGVAPDFAPLGYGAGLDTTDSTTASLRYTGSFLDKHLRVNATLGWNRTDQARLTNDGTRPGTTLGAAGVPQTQYRGNPPLSIREFEELPEGVAELCEPAGFTPTTRATSRGLSRFVMACPVTGSGAAYTLGGRGFLMESQADRLQARADVSYLFELLGHHVLRAGADVEWTQVRLTKAYSGGVSLVGSRPGDPLVGQRDEAFLAGPDDRIPLLSVRSSPSQFTTGLFLQESWNVLDAVTLSGGLRYDTQQLFASNGQLGLTLNNMLSPRLGLIYDFTRQGRSKVFVNYAVQHQNLPLHLADRGLSGQYSTLTRSDADGNALPLNVDPLSPSPDVVRLAAGRLMVDPSLKPMAKGEITAGLEYEVVSNLRVGLVGTHNWLFNAVEDMSSGDGATSFIGNPGAGMGAGFPAAERKYFAATLFASRAFSNGWLAQGSYTLSSLYGNYSGLLRPETGQLAPGLSGDFDLKSLQTNTTGPLPGDRTHQFKAYVAKDFEVSSDVTLLAGVTYEGLSGTPISFLAWHPTAGDDAAFVLPRGSGGRTPFIHTVSLRGGMTWKVSKEQSIQVTLDLFNLLNLQEATEVSQQLSNAQLVPANVADGKDPATAACLAGNSPTCQSILQKRVGAATVPVSTNDLNANFKQPTAFQAPFSMRLGVRLFF
ncbi:MAG: TonB-dependent receptor [Myxococcales bacterium]|nr:TonB-dependent receptor [Myxococcales bacterium]